MKTVILSDCHIGSEEANYRDVNRFLRHLICDRLILAGDFFDLWDMSVPDIRRRFADTMSLLRQLVVGGTHVDYIMGNHDEDYLKKPVMATDLLVPMISADLELDDGRKVAVIHGHEFDPIFKKCYTLSRVLAWINRTARKVLGLSAKSFKKKTCTDLRGQKYSDTVDKIHKSAQEAYQKLGYDVLVMGHTHAPTFRIRRGLTIDFYNAGDWKWSNTYVEIEGNNIELKRF